MSDKVQWNCLSCGYNWVGKHPAERTAKPYCPSCKSRQVKVKDWLVDPVRWEEAKQSVFERDKWTCRRCGAKRVPLQAHHSGYGTMKEDYYDPSNLYTLCQSCHLIIHGHHYGNPSIVCWEGWLVHQKRLEEMVQFILERDNWICSRCGTRDASAQVHRDGIRIDPYLPQFRTLCPSCHRIVHNPLLFLIDNLNRSFYWIVRHLKVRRGARL